MNKETEYFHKGRIITIIEAECTNGNVFYGYRYKDAMGEVMSTLTYPTAEAAKARARLVINKSLKGKGILTVKGVQTFGKTFF